MPLTVRVSDGFGIGRAVADAVQAGFGNDTINGGNGNDRLQGQESNDIVLGGNGNDDVRRGTGWTYSVVRPTTTRFSLEGRGWRDAPSLLVIEPLQAS